MHGPIFRQFAYVSREEECVTASKGSSWVSASSRAQCVGSEYGVARAHKYSFRHVVVLLLAAVLTCGTVGTFVSPVTAFADVTDLGDGAVSVADWTDLREAMAAANVNTIYLAGNIVRDSTGSPAPSPSTDRATTRVASHMRARTRAIRSTSGPVGQARQLTALASCWAI